MLWWLTQYKNKCCVLIIYKMANTEYLQKLHVILAIPLTLFEASSRVRAPVYLIIFIELPLLIIMTYYTNDNTY